VRDLTEIYVQRGKIELSDAAKLIREGIHSGRFVPGQRLIEADLIQEFGVSRMRVREALRRLEAEGLIEIQKNRGAAVRRISRKEVADTIEVLRAIAVATAEKVTELAELREVRARIRQALEAARHFRLQIAQFDDARQYMNENARFWDVLIELCDNTALSDTRMRLETTLFRLVLEGARVSARKERWIGRHEAILQTMLKGDKARVRRLVIESIEEVEHAILALPDGAFLSSSPRRRVSGR